jgi:hypothetical protein
MFVIHAGITEPKLTISSQGSGNLQIIVVSGPLIAPTYYVLQSTTNLVDWTSIATNQLPANGVATNIVQSTNFTTFFRVYTQYGYD